MYKAVVGDSTGVIALIAWHVKADLLFHTIIRMLVAFEKNPDVKLCLRVDFFDIAEMKSAPPDVCPLGVMHTIPAVKSVAGDAPDAETVDAAFGTQFTIVKASEVHTPDPSGSPSLRSSITGVSNFEVLGQLHPPFRVNIAGVVTDVSEVQPTVGGSGKLVRTLVLSDPNGCQVTIRQLGSAAEDVEVQRQRNVVAYFISGSKAWKPGEAGSLWAYEDSFIKVGSTAKVVPSCMKDVPILPD